MRDHPIPSVTEPKQYRAIGIVRGKYIPKDPGQLTRGFLVDANGLELEAVVLGRVLTLMKRHLDMDKPHLWVVYPRSRETDHLHLQISGVWEPSTLNQTIGDNDLKMGDIISDENIDQLPEGEDYFSIRGELIYTNIDSNDFVIKIRQQPRANGKRPLPFKLSLKGNMPLECLRNFVGLDVRRRENQLHLEEYKVIGPISTRGGKKRGTKKNVNSSSRTERT